MATRIRFIGSYPNPTRDGSGTFYSNAFVRIDDNAMFSLNSNSPKLAGVDNGAVFELDGVAFEPATDAAGQPLTTKQGDPVMNAARDGDAEIRLKFVRNGGFQVVGLPEQA